MHLQEVCRGSKTGTISINIRGTLPCWRIGLGIISCCAKGGKRKICLLRKMHQDILEAVQLQSIVAENDLRDSGHPVEDDQTAPGAAICQLLSAN